MTLLQAQASRPEAEKIGANTTGTGEIFSIREWCPRAKISQAFFFKLKREGRGPRTATAGRRVVVTESPSEYYARMQREVTSKNEGA